MLAAAEISACLVLWTKADGVRRHVQGGVVDGHRECVKQKVWNEQVRDWNVMSWPAYGTNYACCRSRIRIAK